MNVYSYDHHLILLFGQLLIPLIEKIDNQSSDDTLRSVTNTPDRENRQSEFRWHAG